MDNATRGRRSADRAEVAIGANCRTDTGRRAFVAMIDLTAAGCCLFCHQTPFAVGHKVSLHPECLAPISGTVKWSRGSLAGVQFDTELYPAVFVHLAKTHPWRLSQPAKLALDTRVDMTPAVQSELTRMIGRAEARFRERTVPKDVLTTRPSFIGSRPGFTPRPTDRKVIRLFLA